MARTLRFGIGLRDHLSGDLKKAESSISRFARRAVGRFRSIAASVTSVRTAIIGLAAGYIGRSIFRTLTEFEDSILKIKAAGGLTAEELQKVSDRARELGASTEYTAGQVAAAFLELRRGGFGAAKMLGTIKTSLDLAALSGLEMSDASKLLANTLKAFRLETSKASHVADVLVNSANSATTNVQEMSEAFGYALTNTKQVGGTVEELGAALATLANNAITGSMAGTGLRGVILRMIKPSNDLEEMLKRLGLTMRDIDPRRVGLVGAFEALNRAGAQFDDLAQIFEARQITTAAILLQNVREFRQLTEANERLNNVTEKGAEIIRSGLSTAWKAMISALQELVLKGGDGGLLGQAKNFLREITDYLRSDAAAQFARSIGGHIGDFLKNLTEGFKELKPVIEETLQKIVQIVDTIADLIALAKDPVSAAKRGTLQLAANASDDLKKLDSIFDRYRRAAGGDLSSSVNDFPPPRGAGRLPGGGRPALTSPEQFPFVGPLPPEPVAPAAPSGLRVARPRADLVGPAFAAIGKGVQTAFDAIRKTPEAMNSFVNSVGYGVAKLQALIENLKSFRQYSEDAAGGARSAFDQLVREGSPFELMRNGILSVNDALVGGLSNTLTDVLTLTKDVGEAFEELGKSFGRQIVQITTTLLLQGAISSGLQSLGFGTGGGSLFGLKPPGAAGGGVFSGPRTGYPVILHGTEKVTPISKAPLLDDGRGPAVAVSVINNISAVDNRSLDAKVLDSFARQQSKISEAVFARAARKHARGLS